MSIAFGIREVIGQRLFTSFACILIRKQYKCYEKTGQSHCYLHSLGQLEMRNSGRHCAKVAQVIHGINLAASGFCNKFSPKCHHFLASEQPCNASDRLSCTSLLQGCDKLQHIKTVSNHFVALS